MYIIQSQLKELYIIFQVPITRNLKKQEIFVIYILNWDILQN